MIKSTFFLVILFLGNLLYSQKFEGIITYQCTYSSKNFEKILNNPNASIEKKKRAKGQLRFLKAMNHQSFLIFNSSESIYSKDANLSLEYFNIQEIPENRDRFYKDFKNKKYIKKTETGGNRYLICDSLLPFSWILSSEQKNIGSFTCHKAYFKEEKKVSTERVQNVDGSFTTVEVKKGITTTAWYAPEIPISNGPDVYWGLPGLILEINTTGGIIDVSYIANEIIINPEQKIKITPPKGGKQVTLEEYEKALRLKQ